MSREPIPLLLKRSNYKIPIIESFPYIGLDGAVVSIAALAALFYIGLLIWSLLPPTKLAILPALVWSILLIVGAKKKNPMRLLPALGFSAIVIGVLVLFVIVDALIFVVLVTVEWLLWDFELVQKFVVENNKIDWKYAILDFYLLLCLAMFLIGLWVIVYSLFWSMRVKSKPNGMELNIKFKSAPVECVD